MEDANRRFIDTQAHKRLPKTVDSGLADAYFAFSESEFGKKILADLLKQVNGTPMNNENLDPNTAVWIVGRQNLISYVYRMIQIGEENAKKSNSAAIQR